jgi:undecaprenyl diphosphate synthase
MDGNRRWAQQKGWQTFVGHRKGVDTITPVIQFCVNNNIQYLSLYAFSIENFKRSETEKGFLFGLIEQELHGRVQEFVSNNIRVRFIGDRVLFPESIARLIDHVEHETAACTGLNLNFLFCYGAQQEIAHAARLIAQDVQRGVLTADAITPTVVSDYLWTRGMPDPDIIIRPGARNRLSNFLLFQSAYSEYFFLDCLWPDLTVPMLEQVYQEFQDRKRNFGQ